MKRTIVLLVTFIMIFSFVACGDKTAFVNCPNCDVEVLRDALYCSNCGVALNGKEIGENEETLKTAKPINTKIVSTALRTNVATPTAQIPNNIVLRIL